MENGVRREDDLFLPKKQVNWKRELLKLGSVGCTALCGLGLLLYVKTNILTVLTSVFAIATVAWLTERDTRGPSGIPWAGKTVMVQGRLSGPVQLLIKHLDDMGVTVFACTSNIESHVAQCLSAQCSTRLRLLSLDTTKQKEVTETARNIKDILTNFTRKTLWGMIVVTDAIGSEEEGSKDPLDTFYNNVEFNQLGGIYLLHTFASIVRPYGGRMIHIDLDAQQHKLGDHPAYTISMSALETYIRIFRREVSDKEIHVSSVKYFGQRMKSLTNEGDTTATANASKNSITGYQDSHYADLVKQTIRALFDLSPKKHYVSGQNTIIKRILALFQQ